MITTVRVARVLVILVLAVVTISFVIAVGRPETGPLEKFVLVALIGGCVYAASAVAAIADSAVRRLTRKHISPSPPRF